MSELLARLWARKLRKLGGGVRLLFLVARVAVLVLIVTYIVHWFNETRAKYGGFHARLTEWVRTQDTTNKFYAWELPGAIWFGGIVLFLVFVAGSLVYVLIDTFVKTWADNAKEKAKK
jgi:hypothetical protein